MEIDVGGLPGQLASWLPAQRWFQGKDREIERVDLVDRTMPSDRLVFLDAAVAYRDGSVERYLVALSPDPSGPLSSGGTAWRDATEDDDSMRLVAELACGHTAIPTTRGRTLTGVPITDRRPEPGLPVRPLGVEQSNSSVVLGEDWVLKLFRRLEDGLHPDIELTAALTEQGYEHVPAQHGSLQIAGDGEPTAVAVLSTFVSGSQEAWLLATAEAAGRDAGVLAGLPALGRDVADMHLALSRALGSKRAAPDQARHWSTSMLAQLDRVLATAERVASSAAAALDKRAGDIRSLFSGLADVTDPGPLVRIHGDLHLGQVLAGPDGRWLLLDFEGEPLRPLAERRRKDSVLRDVAGMLRSLDYAAAAADPSAISREALAWRDGARQRFLSAYLERAAPLLPSDVDLLLTAFQLDKAVYELGYELANRPSWAAIPAGGIERLLDGDLR